MRKLPEKELEVSGLIWKWSIHENCDGKHSNLYFKQN